MKKIQRSPEQTVQKILKASIQEFSLKGFSGARVDSIAKKAKVNKRMIYHYFGNKLGLYKAVLKEALCRKQDAEEQQPKNLAEKLIYFQRLHLEDPHWIRILQWEALEVGNKKVVDENDRSEELREHKEFIIEGQKQGLIPKELDPENLLLSLMALTIFPFAFPQLVRMLSGKSVSDKEFQEKTRKIYSSVLFLLKLEDL